MVLVSESPVMPSNLDLDDALLRRALEVSGNRTKKAVVTEALEEFIRRREQLGVLELFGQIDFAAGHGSEAARERKTAAS